MYEAPTTTVRAATDSVRKKSMESQLDRANLRIAALADEIERLHDEIATIKANVLEAINVGR